MKSSGSRAMKPSTLSILLMLCAGCAWADEVLELQPRLAETAGAQGQAYVELRDRLVSTASTNALLAAVDDTRLAWRERLVARIVLERILRGADIQALRNYDWTKDPEFNPDWNKFILGFAYQMGPLADPRLDAAGLWYYYLEINWKDTQEMPNENMWRLAEVWASCLLRAAGRAPEGAYRHRVMMDRLADDPPLGKKMFMRFYDALIKDHYSDAVPVLIARFLQYLEMQTGQIREPVEWPYSIGYPGQFKRVIGIADARHAELLEEMVNRYEWLEPCRELLADVLQRPVREADDSEPPFRLMPTPEFLKTGPFVGETAADEK
jgi:hypothetical protein